MSNYSDPVFGPLDDDSPGLWTTKVAFGDRELQADLNIDGDVDSKLVARLTKRLADLPALEAKARAAMVADCAKKKSSVAQYQIHHESISSESDTGQDDSGAKVDITAFLLRCQLTRIALYPECPTHCLILDFALKNTSTDHILVISINSQDEVVGVDMQC